MTEYQLKDRRQISDHFRKLGYGFVDFCVRQHIRPDTISYASMGFAAAAGVLFCFSDRYPVFLLIAPLVTFGRLYCNMIDGMVAIKSRVASRRGEVINELPDRISDTIIFLGLALSGQANRLIAFWVIFGMLAVSYIGVLGKAVGAGRQYGGLMPKPARMFTLAVASYGQFFFAMWYGNAPALFWRSLTIIDLANVLILGLLVQTAVVRTSSMLTELDGV